MKTFEILPVPPGCMEAPGYILTLRTGPGWITLDGRMTDKWQERGVWPTPEAADKARQKFLSPEKEIALEQ